MEKHMETEPQTTRITIHVTPDDITQGKKGDCERCPAALALARELPSIDRDVVTVDVCDDEITLYGKGTVMRWTAMTPRSLAHWIADFDAGDPVDSERFHLAFARVIREG